MCSRPMFFRSHQLEETSERERALWTSCRNGPARVMDSIMTRIPPTSDAHPVYYRPQRRYGRS